MLILFVKKLCLCYRLTFCLTFGHVLIANLYKYYYLYGQFPVDYSGYVDVCEKVNINCGVIWGGGTRE